MMDRKIGLLTGCGALASFAAGLLVGIIGTRRAKSAPEAENSKGDRNRKVGAGGPRSVESDDLVAQMRRQEDAVRKAIVELTMSLGTAGANQIGLAGKISGMAADLTKLETRRRLAEADAAAIPFPGKDKVDALRTAVGALEAATGQGLAMQDLLTKTTAAIEAWKA